MKHTSQYVSFTVKLLKPRSLSLLSIIV